MKFQIDPPPTRHLGVAPGVKVTGPVRESIAAHTAVRSKYWRRGNSQLLSVFGSV